jgi:hypothetical protein
LSSDKEIYLTQLMTLHRGTTLIGAKSENSKSKSHSIQDGLYDLGQITIHQMAAIREECFSPIDVAIKKH